MKMIRLPKEARTMGLRVTKTKKTGLLRRKKTMRQLKKMMMMTTKGLMRTKRLRSGG